MQKLNVFEAVRNGEQIRNRMLDMPYGDPFSGAPYGERLKSKGLGMIIGVVASVATMGAAMPLLAGTTMASQLAGGAMMAGGVLNGVGTVTGNKKLTKIGGVLSLAGGLGGAAVSGTFGSGIADAAKGMGGGSSAIQSMSGSFMDSVNSLGLGNIYNPETVAAAKGAGQSTATLSPAGAEAVGGVGGAEVSPVTDTAGAVEARPLYGADAPLGGKAPELQIAGTDQSSGIINKQVADTGGGIKGGVQTNLKTQAGSDVASASTPAQANKSGGILSFAKDNAELLKLGAGVVQGFTAPNTQPQIDALTAKYEGDSNLLKTQNEILQYQQANMGKQVAMISADAPDADAQVKVAKAKGLPFAFIQPIGTGYNPPRASNTPPVRPSTYNKATV